MMGCCSEGSKGVDIDGVKYQLQAIKDDAPFDHCNGTSRDPFTADLIVTTDYPVYEDLDRKTANCMVRTSCGWQRPETYLTVSDLPIKSIFSVCSTAP